MRIKCINCKYFIEPKERNTDDFKAYIAKYNYDYRGSCVVVKGKVWAKVEWNCNFAYYISEFEKKINRVLETQNKMEVSNG